MSSWRPLVAGTVGVFLIVLAFLAGQLKAGGDPGLRPSGSTATAQPTPQATPNPQDGSGADPSDPGFGESDPYGDSPDGSAPNGATPDGVNPGGTTPDVSPPTTHQS